MRKARGSAPVQARWQWQTCLPRSLKIAAGADLIPVLARSTQVQRRGSDKVECQYLPEILVTYGKQQDQMLKSTVSHAIGLPSCDLRSGKDRWRPSLGLHGRLVLGTSQGRKPGRGMKNICVEHHAPILPSHVLIIVLMWTLQIIVIVSIILVSEL
jgi:hypothetical protein